MKLKKRGKNISKVEILNISRFGLWVYINTNEHFLSYADFPWFKDATLSQIQNVQLLHGFHLYWPDLDVDLHVDSLINTEKYSLISK